MSHTNPLGHEDRFRSDERQRVSDQLLASLVAVAADDGPVRLSVKVVAGEVDVDRARELVYSAAWFHDTRGQWRPGSDRDPARLVHRVDLDVHDLDATGFVATMTRRPHDATG